MAGSTSRSDCQLPNTTPSTSRATITRGFSRLSRLGKVNCGAFHGNHTPNTYWDAAKQDTSAAAESTATVLSAKRVRSLTRRNGTQPSMDTKGHLPQRNRTG